MCLLMIIRETEVKAMYSIIMRCPVKEIKMPNDTNLTLAEACFRIECYKKSNPFAYYFVVDENGNEFEM